MSIIGTLAREVTARRPATSRQALDCTIALLRHDPGALIRTAALIRDVTTRWQQERALEERVGGLVATVASVSQPLTRDNAEYSV